MTLQGTWIWFLIWGDRTKPVGHNCWARAPWSLCSATRSQCHTTREQPRSPQLVRALSQQQRLSAAKTKNNKQIKCLKTTVRMTRFGTLRPKSGKQWHTYPETLHVWIKVRSQSWPSPAFKQPSPHSTHSSSLPLTPHLRSATWGNPSSSSKLQGTNADMTLISSTFLTPRVKHLHNMPEPNASRPHLAWVLSHFSRDQLFALPWTTAHHALLSMGFSRQRY